MASASSDGFYESLFDVNQVHAALDVARRRVSDPWTRLKVQFLRDI